MVLLVPFTMSIVFTDHEGGRKINQHTAISTQIREFVDIEVFKLIYSTCYQSDNQRFAFWLFRLILRFPLL